MPRGGPGKTRATRRVLEARVERAEELLCSGLTAAQASRALQEQYGVVDRRARAYCAEAQLRWRGQAQADSVTRREKVFRMAERHYARCVRARQFSAATGTLSLLAKMSGAFTPDQGASSALLEQLGPPPTDPMQAMPYAQRALLLALNEVAASASMDPERRLRWISELGGRVGMTYSRSMIQDRVDKLGSRLLGSGEAGEDDGEGISDAEWEEHRGVGAAGQSGASVPGSLPAASPEDEP